MLVRGYWQLHSAYSSSDAATPTAATATTAAVTLELPAPLSTVSGTLVTMPPRISTYVMPTLGTYAMSTGNTPVASMRLVASEAPEEGRDAMMDCE